MSLHALTASDLMSSDVLTVEEGASVAELAAFLLENEISGAPVVTAHHEVVGVVSLTDIARAESERDVGRRWVPGGGYFRLVGHTDAGGWEGFRYRTAAAEDLLVRDIMSPKVHSVAPEVPIPMVAQTMLQYHLHRLLVLEDGNRLVGIVTTFDLLTLLTDHPHAMRVYTGPSGLAEAG